MATGLRFEAQGRLDLRTPWRDGLLLSSVGLRVALSVSSEVVKLEKKKLQGTISAGIPFPETPKARHNASLKPNMDTALQTS